MNEYLKQYIELQKQFRETEGNPDSVRALYTFKEKLEQSEDKQAKEVLVDVYDLLDFKKDAYELLRQIGNRSNKKMLKRLGVLKDYAENWGNHYAIPKPKCWRKSRKRRSGRPNWACPPSGITRTLWKLALLRSPQQVLSVIAVARRLIFFIPIRFFPWKILSICAQSASPTAKRPGNMMAVFRMITLCG